MNDVNSLTYNSYSKIIIDGKTLFDYSRVTAAPEKVREGVTYVDKTGAIKTGAMPTLSGVTYTPKEYPQTIPVGKYTGSNVVIAGEPNLLAEHILDNVEIFGVKGSATTTGFNGYDEPGIYSTIIGNTTLDKIYLDSPNLKGIEFKNAEATSAIQTCQNAPALRAIFNFPANIVNAPQMFNGCLTLSNFSVDKLPETLINGQEMFRNCKALTNANFLTDGLNVATSMFFDCIALQSVNYVPSTLGVTNTMFQNCSALTDFNEVACTGPLFHTATTGIVKNNLQNINTFSGSDLNTALSGFINFQYFGGFSGNALSATMAVSTFKATNFGNPQSKVNLPNSIITATTAYESTKGITNVRLPNELVTATSMFINSSVVNVFGSCPKLVTGTTMFKNCQNLRYIETLPASLTTSTNMFVGINVATSKLTINKINCTGQVFYTAGADIRALPLTVNKFGGNDLSNLLRDYTNIVYFNGFQGEANSATMAQSTFQSTKFLNSGSKINLPDSIQNLQYAYRDMIGVKNIKLPYKAINGASACRSVALERVYGNCPNMVDISTMFSGAVNLRYLQEIPPKITSMANCFAGACTTSKNLTIEWVNCPGPSAHTATAGIKAIPISINHFAGNDISSCARGFTNIKYFGGFYGSALGATLAVDSFRESNFTGSKYINLPDSVINGYRCYYGTQGITDVQLPANLTTVTQMFASSSVKRVYGMSNKLTDVTGMFQSCKNLTYIDKLPSTLTTVTNLFAGITATSQLTIGTMETNKVFPSPFTTFIKQVDLYSNSNGDNVFRGSNLENIVCGTQLTNAYRMFENCQKLKSVSFRSYLGELLVNNVNQQYNLCSLKNTANCFYNAKCESSIFPNSNLKYFSALVNFSSMFRFFNATNNPTLSLYLSPVNNSSINVDGSYAFANITTGLEQIQIVSGTMNFNFTGLLSGTPNIKNIYLNIGKSNPNMRNWLQGKNQNNLLNIHIPFGSPLRSAFYNGGQASTTYFPWAMTWENLRTAQGSSFFENTKYNIKIYCKL